MGYQVRAAERLPSEQQARRSSGDRRHEEMRQQQRTLPEVATLGLPKEEGAIAGRRRGQRKHGPRERLEHYPIALPARQEPEPAHGTLGEEDPPSPYEPRPPIGLEEKIEEALGTLQVEDEERRRQREKGEADQRCRP